MPSLFRQVFGKKEERLDQNGWASMYDQMFSFNGNAYPITGYGSTGNKSEEIENDFTGYCKQAYKANGIVFACQLTRQLIFTEMTFCYQERRGTGQKEIFGSKELKILENPWPNGTTGELLSRALQDVDLAGNHYVVREYDRKTRTERLRRLRPDWVTIALSQAPEDGVKSNVTGYIYRPDNTQNPDKWVVYPIDGSNGAIAHWSPIPDPEAQYRGMSWITPIINEILGDKGATKHKQKFFDQGATPQLAVSLKDVTTPDQFKEFMALLDNSHNGVDSAYKTMYLAGGADVTVVGAHLQQLDFRDMQGHGETRIAAAARIHPTLVGMSEALRGTPLNIDNYQASKDMAGEMFLRPYWRSLCAAYQALVPKVNGQRLWFDDRDVSFLRQDRQAQADLLLSQANTANQLVMAGYSPETIKSFFLADGDWNVLEHTGLTSVQLLPPGQSQTSHLAEAGLGKGGLKVPSADGPGKQPKPRTSLPKAGNSSTS